MTVSELSLTKWVEILLLYTGVTISFFIYLFFWSDYFKTWGKAFSHLQYFSVLILCPTPYPYSLSPHLPTHFFVNVYLYFLNYHFKFSLLKEKLYIFFSHQPLSPFLFFFLLLLKKKKKTLSPPLHTPQIMSKLLTSFLFLWTVRRFESCNWVIKLNTRWNLAQ